MTADVISIPRASLHEQVAQRLRQMLVEGQIAPGAKLNERELAELLQVSRTPKGWSSCSPTAARWPSRSRKKMSSTPSR